MQSDLFSTRCIFLFTIYNLIRFFYMPFQSVRKVFQRKENPHFIKSFSFFLQEILSVIYHRIWQFLLKFHQ